MTSFRAEDRIDPPTASDEAATLLGFLNYQRDTLRWKCTGLTTVQLSTPVAPTTLTLGGLLKHLAVVEAGWLNQFFAGGVAKPSWFDELDQDDPDWSLTSAAGTAPEQLFAWFDESIAVSDQVIADALAGPDGLAALSEGQDDGKRISLRWIVCHLIEEYARHNGHADLLRESIERCHGADLVPRSSGVRLSFTASRRGPPRRGRAGCRGRRPLPGRARSASTRLAGGRREARPPPPWRRG